MNSIATAYTAYRKITFRESHLEDVANPAEHGGTEEWLGT